MMPPRSRLRLFTTAALTLALAGCAHPGVSTLNGFAALRGHQAATDLAYGPLARQRFDLYAPPDGAPSPAPLVVFVYGGGWTSGSRAEYRFAGEALAAQGFEVMVVDYGLAPEVRYPDFLKDCAIAVGFAFEHAAAWRADPHRVVLYGHSAGAYNVAMLALDPRWLKAVGHAPDELAGWVGLAGPYDFVPIGDPGTRLAFGGPNPAPDTQPIHHVGDLARSLPAFLGAAKDDQVVDPERNTAQLAAALRARGATVTEKTYDHVNHATLLGSITFPLQPLAPVLADTAAFIRALPPSS